MCVCIYIYIYIYIGVGYTDEDHNDGWARLGTGFCLDDTKPVELQHLPAMYRSGVTLAEVKALCDKYSTCVALDFGVHQDESGIYGIARFSSAAALDAISEPEWEKWSEGCQDNCVPRITGDADIGACYVKGIFFQPRVLQIHMYSQRKCEQPHARALSLLSLSKCLFCSLARCLANTNPHPHTLSHTHRQHLLFQLRRDSY